MLSNRQTLALYKKTAIISQQMLNMARQHNWEQMAFLELRYTQLVTLIKSNRPLKPLNGEMRNAKVKLIHNILANDRAIRDLTTPWLNDIPTLLSKLPQQQH
jgi:flagellar protein FliT